LTDLGYLFLGGSDQMNTGYSNIRAVYQGGVLRLLDPLQLAEGTEVCLRVEIVPTPLPEPLKEAGGLEKPVLAYPTRFVRAERLDPMICLVQVGGDALADSEALYDPRWD